MVARTQTSNLKPQTSGKLQKPQGRSQKSGVRSQNPNLKLQTSNLREIANSQIQKNSNHQRERELTRDGTGWTRMERLVGKCGGQGRKMVAERFSRTTGGIHLGGREALYLADHSAGLARQKGAAGNISRGKCSGAPNPSA